MLKPEAEVAGVAFSPDNKRVAAAGTDRVLRICDASSGRMVWETNGLAGPGQDVGYSPDGRWLVTTQQDPPRLRHPAFHTHT